MLLIDGSGTGAPLPGSNPGALFADLPEDELAILASVASEVEIASGQAPAGEGACRASLFAMRSEFVSNRL